MKITQFGNSVLREHAKFLSEKDISSKETKTLIKEMKYLLVDRKLGIGLAAPQVGVSVQLAVIEIQKSTLRNNVEEVSLVIFNPKITKYFGYKSKLWEGCISSGNGKANLFGIVPRYKKITLNYMDEHSVKHTKTFTGLLAHVIQHEVDHLNGILFVDKVKDTKSYMTYSEYKKMKQREATKK